MNLFRIKTFIKSLIFHLHAGLPKCTKQQILERYEICLSCDHFNEKMNRCMVCGCNINNKKVFMNKLAWADQECPLKKWLKN
jgi:uncharacterized paraquat-inducible protein A